MDTSEVYVEPPYVSAGSRCSHAFIIHTHIYFGWHTSNSAYLCQLQQSRSGLHKTWDLYLHQ